MVKALGVISVCCMVVALTGCDAGSPAIACISLTRAGEVVRILEDAQLLCVRRDLSWSYMTREPTSLSLSAGGQLAIAWSDGRVQCCNLEVEGMPVTAIECSSAKSLSWSSNGQLAVAVLAGEQVAVAIVQDGEVSRRFSTGLSADPADPDLTITVSWHPTEAKIAVSTYRRQPLSMVHEGAIEIYSDEGDRLRRLDNFGEARFISGDLLVARDLNWWGQPTVISVEEQIRRITRLPDGKIKDASPTAVVILKPVGLYGAGGPARLFNPSSGACLGEYPSKFDGGSSWPGTRIPLALDARPFRL